MTLSKLKIAVYFSFTLAVIDNLYAKEMPASENEGLQCVGVRALGVAIQDRGTEIKALIKRNYNVIQIFNKNIKILSEPKMKYSNPDSLSFPNVKMACKNFGDGSFNLFTI